MTNSSSRILSLVPYKIFPAMMGGQKGIALFYKYLSRFVSLTVLTTQKNESKESYTVINEISNSSLRYLNIFLFFNIKKIAASQQSTHLLFEHPYYAWLIFLCRLFLNKTIILHTHNIESERFKSVGKWWWKVLFYYEKWAMKNADIIWFKTPEDARYAHIHYGIPESKCTVIPYGIENNQLPHESEILSAKKTVQEQYGISPDELILLFNGTLSYKPNLDALNSILEKINPVLSQSNLRYKILICGKGLPDEMNELKNYISHNIIYCGFVQDIDLYFKACDIFLNPLQDGGGIKTKLVEALGFGKFALSSVNGAIGVDKEVCGGRLAIVPDKDWAAYANAVLQYNAVYHANDNSLFYQNFSWQNIAAKATESIRNAQ